MGIRTGGAPGATAQPRSRPSIDEDAVRRSALALFAAQGYRATTMADIGAVLGIRGPSLYRHVGSKQELLVSITVQTMRTLLADQAVARSAGGDVVQRLRRMVEVHVRFHAANRERAFVGNREIDNLEQPHRQLVLELRREYEHQLRSVIEEGRVAGVFHVDSPRLASYAILEMGIGVATWFRPDGPHGVDEIAFAHAEFALGLLRGVAQPAMPRTNG